MEILISHYRSNIVSGAERAIVEMVQRMDKNFSCTMLVPGDGVLADFYRSLDQNVWIKKISTPRRKYPGLHYFQSKKTARELKQRQIKLVICNTFSAASRISTASRMAGIPYIIYMREYVKDTSLHRKVLRKADQVLAVSKDLKNHIQTMLPEKEVLLAYDVIARHPIEERILEYKKIGCQHSPFAAAHPLVGWVGRITPYKQPLLFVRTIPYVVEKLPSVRFILIGSASEKEKYLEMELRETAAALGVTDKISFLGLRDDVIELMIEMSAFCLTSTREPLARVIFEAQLVGCPVIVPQLSGPAEVVNDYLTGLKFDALAEDAHRLLGEKIIELLNDKELAAGMRERAFLEVKQTFASDQPVRAFETILLDVM